MPGVRNLPPYAAVVLAGGAASRLGGADKGSLELAGRTLLDLTLAAVAGAAEVVVVGDPEPGGSNRRPVTFVRERPAYGGPAAALLAGRDALAGDHRTLVVLACDMPEVTAATVLRLREADGADGAVLVGPGGRRQLALALDVARLDEVAPAPSARTGLAVWRMLAALELISVPAVGREHRDVDTWTDLRDLSP